MNIVPISMLTRYMLPLLLKKKSCIINLSSFSSYSALVGGAGYSSSKLYDDFFSRALAYENKNKIDILSFKPLLVSTPLTRNMSSLLTINKNQCVKGSLKAVGWSDETFGHLSHHIQAQICLLVPKYMLEFFGNLYWKWFTSFSHEKNPTYTPVKQNP